jgi:hypothetical protein
MTSLRKIFAPLALAIALGGATTPRAARAQTAATVELGYTAFRAGPAAQAMALGVNGASRHWAYLQLKAGF